MARGDEEIHEVEQAQPNAPIIREGSGALRPSPGRPSPRRNEAGEILDENGVVLNQSNLEEQIEKKEQQIINMEASVFQLANYYFVFQVLLISPMISGGPSASLTCNHFWLPFSLSMIAAILNFASLLIIANKYTESLDQLDDKILILYRNFFVTTSKKLEMRHRRKRMWRHVMLNASMFLFFAFVILNLVGTWLILCHSI